MNAYETENANYIAEEITDELIDKVKNFLATLEKDYNVSLLTNLDDNDYDYIDHLVACIMQQRYGIDIYEDLGW